MTDNPCPTLTATDPDAMDSIGRALAASLHPGDFVAVSGPLGAGKSHLCRAIVRAILRDHDAQVPSPSYTLVNAYTVGEIEVWHSDLYRIADASELAELGLDDPPANVIVLMEWPERMTRPPPRRAQIKIRPQADDSRLLELCTQGPHWDRLRAQWSHMA